MQHNDLSYIVEIRDISGRTHLKQFTNQSKTTFRRFKGKGVYTVRVRAVDSYGGMTPWSQPLPVTPNGGDIIVDWSDPDGNKIFKLDDEMEWYFDEYRDKQFDELI